MYSVSKQNGYNWIFTLEYGIWNSCLHLVVCTWAIITYSATTWTGPLRTKLTNQSVNWEQRMAPFFVNGPMKLKNENNGLITKIWNPTKLRRVADLSGNFITISLVPFDPIFLSSIETAWMWPLEKKCLRGLFRHLYAYKRPYNRVMIKNKNRQDTLPINSEFRPKFERNWNHLLKVACQWSQHLSPTTEGWW